MCGDIAIAVADIAVQLPHCVLHKVLRRRRAMPRPSECNYHAEYCGIRLAIHGVGLSMVPLAHCSYTPSGKSDTFGIACE
jgi:hypothetical protein